MSNAFAALIWWVVPAAGLIGALGYVLWVTKFQGKFQQETQRSVGQFQRFQDSFRDSQARDVATGGAIITTTAAVSDDDVNDQGPDAINDFGAFDSGSFDAGSAN